MERIVLYTERKAINQPLRSQSGYSTFDQPLDRYDASTSTTVSTEITPRPPPSRLSVVVISVVTVVTSVMMTVSLPVFSGTMNSVGGDTFVVLFYGTAWTPVVCFAMLLIYKVRCPCAHAHLFVCLFMCVRLCMYTCVHAYMCICLYVCAHLSMYICVRVCAFYVRACVCLLVPLKLSVAAFLI